MSNETFKSKRKIKRGAEEETCPMLAMHINWTRSCRCSSYLLTLQTDFKCVIYYVEGKSLVFRPGRLCALALARPALDFFKYSSQI